MPAPRMQTSKRVSDGLAKEAEAAEGAGVETMVVIVEGVQLVCPQVS